MSGKLYDYLIRTGRHKEVNAMPPAPEKKPECSCSCRTILPCSKCGKERNIKFSRHGTLCNECEYYRYEK